MNHPYRTEAPSPDAGATPSCFFCRARARLACVSWKRIALSVVALSFLGANVACALVAYAYARLTEETLMASSVLEHRMFAMARRNQHGGPSVLAPPAAPASSTPPARVMIVQLDANEFTLSRDALDKVLEGQSDLQRQAQVVPEAENGRVIGVRLFGVRPDTLLGALGFENGDLLQTLNGLDISSPDKALEAYGRLRTVRDLRVDVKRRGAKVELRYHLI
jgi:hypothetical protein